MVHLPDSVVKPVIDVSVAVADTVVSAPNPSKDNTLDNDVNMRLSSVVSRANDSDDCKMICCLFCLFVVCVFKRVVK